jgi:hypothetical protein
MMFLHKKRKFVQVFSDGSLNFSNKNINLNKTDLYSFQENDLKNFEFYKKPIKKKSKVQNFYYRKKYLDI